MLDAAEADKGRILPGQAYYYTRGVRDAWWDELRNCYTAYYAQHADIPGTLLDRTAARPPPIG